MSACALVTVLPETPVSSHNMDYSWSLKSASPEAVECGSGTVTTLQSASHRYDTSYAGGGGYWGGGCTTSAPHNYNSYYSSGSPVPSQSYPPPPPPPPMVLYPSVYSTVNQNQIHLHLHHNEARPEYNEDLTALVGNNVTISGGTRGIEIGILPHNQLPSEDVSRQHGDQAVWRPY